MWWMERCASNQLWTADVCSQLWERRAESQQWTSTTSWTWGLCMGAMRQQSCFDVEHDALAQPGLESQSSDGENIRTSFPHLPLQSSFADTNIMDVRTVARQTTAGAPGRTTGGVPWDESEATHSSHSSGWSQGRGVGSRSYATHIPHYHD